MACRPMGGFLFGGCMRPTYKATMFACFTGYVVQAIVNNFVPLLFLTFQASYGIPLEQITLLVTVNFCVQLLVDLLATLFVDRIGYRLSIVLAQFFAAAGLALLTLLPQIMPPFTGILIAVVTYAIGGGLIEVLVSPIMESCPTENKETAMSLLHSFYCWGHVGVVLLSTGFFALFGIQNWRLLCRVWALIPIINGILFCLAPIPSLLPEGTQSMRPGQLFRSKVFWAFVVMMVCAGASEQAVSQWASAFAEKGLGISKTLGDLAGPLTFAVLMGSARAIYGKFGDRIDLGKFMTGSIFLCIFSYLLTALAPWPVLSLVGCGICGFSVGILWPGTFSRAAAALPTGGTVMFALFALAGDLGCASGPTLAGFVSGAMGDNLKAGILAAIVFPLGMLLLLRKKSQTAGD